MLTSCCNTRWHFFACCSRQFVSTARHVAHVILFIVLLKLTINSSSIPKENWSSVRSNIRDELRDAAPVELPRLLQLLLLILRLLPLMALPQALFVFLGLTLFNAFPPQVKLKPSALLAPFICLRIVTRGTYPDLVRTNVARHLETCQRVNFDNFRIEVVTDKKMDLPANDRVRQVVVPSSYRTQNGALFKARALQYCLEEEVNILSDNDWIVHLDEETIVTDASLRGILNFISDGTHQFGQGLITYSNEHVQNWLTTFADCIRIADDMGKQRFQLKVFHKPLLGCKGSYLVTQVGAERRVSFDHGPDGSIAEDNYFAMVAARDGYTFDFIDGEMWEKSPFTIYDFFQQRKRWLQGLLLVVHSRRIPVSTKFLLSVTVYAWVTMPVAFVSFFLSSLFSVSVPSFVTIAGSFVASVNIYMYIYGAFKAFRVERIGWFKMIACIGMVLMTVPFNILIENLAVIRGVFGHKHQFYIVNKHVDIDLRGGNIV